jgi:type I restriction enzyme R subunit
VLTHLRTDLIAAEQNASLTEGSDEPLIGPGEGRGKQHEEPTDSLSALIDALNERFGMNLTDADRIWFDQQEAHLRADEDVRVVALNNDLEQFKVYLEPKLQDGIIDRQEQNGALFEAFFDKPDFKEAMQAWISERLYRNIRGA